MKQKQSNIFGVRGPLAKVNVKLKTYEVPPKTSSIVIDVPELRPRVYEAKVVIWIRIISCT